MYPVLFTVPFLDLPIHSYGVMLGFALVIGWFLTQYLGRRDGLESAVIGRTYIWTAACALIGARILFWATNPELLSAATFLDLLDVKKGGMVAYGGFLGGFLGALFYTKLRGASLLAFADAAAPALGSGLGLARIGCLLYGCDYGKLIPSGAPRWLVACGIRFPNWDLSIPQVAQRLHFEAGTKGSAAFWHHVHIGLLSPGQSHSLAVYPTQVLSMANGWLALGLTLLVRRHSRFRGQAFLVFVAYYGLTRSLIELLRGDLQRGGFGAWSTSQIIGVGTAAAAIVAYTILMGRAKAQ